MRKYLLFFSLFLLFSFTGTSLKKRISDVLYRYEFYTTDKKTDALTDRQYYWFKGGAIHSSEYGTGGELLTDDYIKYYHNNQLAEAGKFKNGLKTGTWKTWFKNGTLQSKAYWKNGQLNGDFNTYDELGFPAEYGNYKANKKHGRWISYISKDTTYYKKGLVVIKEKKKKTPKDSIANSKSKKGFLSFLKKKEKPKQPQPVAPMAAPKTKETKQPGLFSRIFSKKTTKESNYPVNKASEDKSRQKEKNKTAKNNG